MIIREGPERMPDGRTRFTVRGDGGAVTLYVPEPDGVAGPVVFHHPPGEVAEAFPPGPEEAWQLGFRAGRAGMGDTAAVRQQKIDLAGGVEGEHLSERACLPLSGCDILPGGWCRCEQGFLMGRDCGDIFASAGEGALWAELDALYRGRMGPS